MSLPSNPTCVATIPDESVTIRDTEVTIIGGGAACIAAGCVEVRTGAERPPSGCRRSGAEQAGTEFAKSSPSVSGVSPWLKVRPTCRASLRTFVQHSAKL